MYAVKVKATGETCETLDTLEQARETISAYEWYDRKYGKYIHDRYGIAEIHPVTLTITLTLDPESAYITDLDITQGVDHISATKPLSINNAMRAIDAELTSYL